MQVHPGQNSFRSQVIPICLSAIHRLSCQWRVDGRCEVAGRIDWLWAYTCNTRWDRQIFHLSHRTLLTWQSRLVCDNLVHYKQFLPATRITHTSSTSLHTRSWQTYRLSVYMRLVSYLSKFWGDSLNQWVWCVNSQRGGYRILFRLVDIQ